MVVTLFDAVVLAAAVDEAVVCVSSCVVAK